ncbi:MAG: S-layer homology domain-containing protein [Clostridia bacterium]|nr:S-layer homology domain-containing protein [Clostridia bacterium]
MKRILSLTMIMIFALGISVSGAQVTLKDAREDVIKVSGNSNGAKYVSLMILNPGYTESDILSDASEYAIQFYGDEECDEEGNYTIDISMSNRTSEGGEFTLLLATDKQNVAEKSTFDFYFSDKKLETIEILNENVGNIEDVIPYAYKIYSLNKSDIYRDTSTEAIADALEEAAPFEEDVDEMFRILQESVMIASFNEGVDSLFVNDVFECADYIGLDGTPLYEDYVDALSASGRKAVNSRIIKKNYSDVEKIKDNFEQQVLLNVITNYGKNLGFGHVGEYFEKYSAEYTAAGFNLTKLTKLDDKDTVYLALANSEATTLDELLKEYKKLVKTDDSEGGAGGGGGGSSVSQGSVSIPVSDIVGDGYVVNPDAIILPFNDMDGTVWAKEAVSELYKKSIISGKSKTEFAPGDVVTREEFTKMIVLAFLGEPGQSETNFTDVSGWSTPYIAFAANKGIVSGVGDGIFKPKGNISREQAATIIARAINKDGKYEKSKTDFADNSSISSWAKEGVAFLSDNGIVSGRGNNMFCPADNMTRAEAAVIIYNSMKFLGV